ncbi:MAG: trypsin-like peptidase domain-containing protein [Planctomycetes bacterium]|nr:trypsin-like peptidase domain-containing protein [Planctomycetota bacterium]
MKRIIFSIIIALLFISVGNVPATTIPQEIKDTVTFIFIKNDSGQVIPNGTGFFVGIKDENDPNISYIYLVTAKHVLLDDKTNSLFNSVYVRLNKKTGDAQMFEIPLCGSNAVKVYSHKDATVDITLIPLAPDPNIFDCKWIPVNMITTKEIFKEAKIREGDDVFFVGLFTPYYGNQRNYPITRFGRVALITDEKIPWKDKKDEVPKMLDLYLVESQSFGGNSGAPVFFYFGLTREPDSLSKEYKFLLAGIMKGCYLDAREIQVAETSKIPISLENVGIAAVVPAYRLYELLFSDELKNIRPEKKVK